jgi:hypothetical protein
MAPLKWLCCAACFLCLVVPFLDCASSPEGKPGLSDLECYLVQMHIHGHSNHNGNDLPASMDSHCSEAKRHGFDVIWWTDHARLFEAYDEDIRVDFANAYVDPGSGSIIFKEGQPRELTRLNVNRTSDRCRIDVKDGSLLITVESPPDSPDFTGVVLSLGSERGKVHTVDYCRPITSELRFKAWCDIEGLSDDAYVDFGFDFSLHPGGQHHARYKVVERFAKRPALVGDTTVMYETGYLYPQDMIFIDLTSSVRPLPNGDENTLSSAWMEVVARKGKTISVKLDSLRMVSMADSGRNQYDMAEAYSRRYFSQYGITQYTGVEIGLLHTPRLPHMNAYFPDSTQTFESVSLDRSMRRDLWVKEVHRRGGLVSLNHPFGASLTPRHGKGTYYPSGISIRDLWKSGNSVEEADFWDVAKPILDDDGLGADILEVGYLFRGTGSLEDHLRLWDLALANGINLVGDGASDSHGGYWGPDMVPNPFASWIWAKSKDADDLLRALKAGRVAFGDPFLWKSDFAFGVEEAMMGDTLFTDRPTVRGWIHMVPWRDDVDIRLVQVELKKGRELSVIRNESIDYDRSGIEIDVDRPCFVRTEVYSDDGTPLVFSNPVFLLPK